MPNKSDDDDDEVRDHNPQHKHHHRGVGRGEVVEEEDVEDVEEDACDYDTLKISFSAGESSMSSSRTNETDLLSSSYETDLLSSSYSTNEEEGLSPVQQQQQQKQLVPPSTPPSLFERRDVHRMRHRRDNLVRVLVGGVPSHKNNNKNSLVSESTDATSLVFDPFNKETDVDRNKKQVRKRYFFSFCCYPSKLSCRVVLVVIILVSTLLHMGIMMSAAARYYQRALTYRRIQRNMNKITRLMSSSSSSSLPNTFTILLRGSRVDLMQQSLDQHARCPMVSQVQIEWTAAADDQDEEEEEYDLPETLFDHGSGKISSWNEKTIKQQLDTSSTNEDDAILLLDEGIYFTCQELERGFLEWQRNPTLMVGLLPPCRTCPHSFVSDEAAFVHRLLLPFDDDDNYDRRRERRTSNNNNNSNNLCQHLALSALLSTASSINKPSSTFVLTNPSVQSILRNEAERERELNRCGLQLQREMGLVSTV